MKINHLMVCAFVITLFFISFVAAPDVDWSSPAATENYEANFVKDPMGGFQADPDKAWVVLSKRPDLLTRTDVLDAAFENDYNFATGIIDKNPDLLNDAKILSKLDQQIRKLNQNAAELLNTNPTVKKTWIYKQYKIEMDSSEVRFNKVEIRKIGLKSGKFLEHLILTTSGSGATTFNAEDYPNGGAKILPDGSLQLFGDSLPQGIVKGCTDFSLKRDEKGVLIINEGSPVFSMQGGELTIDPSPKGFFNLEVKGGKMIVKSNYEWYGNMIYEGDFSASKIDRDISVGGRFTRFYYIDNKYKIEEKEKTERIPQGVLINGKITSNINSFPGEYIIDDSTELKFLSSDSEEGGFNGNVLRIEGNSKVYYSESALYHYEENGEMVKVDPAEFCQEGYTCILNTPGERYNSAYKERFAVYNGQNGDKITYFTPNYYSNVEISNLKEGEAKFISTKLINLGRYDVAAMITALPNSRILSEGNLKEMKVGRMDVFYNQDPTCQKDCEIMLNHWSGVYGMKPGPQEYFQEIYKHNQRRGVSSIVTCSLKVGDCEEKFARAYGKIIAPAGQTPKTTIIVAGDYIDMAKAQETGWCKTPPGCYILDSRNIPPTTDSVDLVVTGHHWRDREYVWRDSPEITNPDNQAHNPIDRTYVSCNRYSHTGCFPESSSVLHLGFSACNTNPPPTIKPDGSLSFNSFTQALFQKYPQIKKNPEGIITGWNNIAPTAESSPRPTIPLEILGRYKLRNGNKGERASLFKLPDGQWYWSTEGKFFCALTPGGEADCKEFTIAKGK